jgi:hypothetical protein
VPSDCWDILCEAVRAGKITSILVYGSSGYFSNIMAVFTMLTSPQNQVRELSFKDLKREHCVPLCTTLASPHCKVTHLRLHSTYIHDMSEILKFFMRGTYPTTTLELDIVQLNAKSAKLLLTLMSTSTHTLDCLFVLNSSLYPTEDVRAAIYSPTCILKHLTFPYLHDTQYAEWHIWQWRRLRMFALLSALLPRSRSPLKGLPTCIFREVFTYM